MIIDTHMHLNITKKKDVNHSIINAEKLRKKFNLSNIFLILLISQNIKMDEFKQYPLIYKNIKFFVDINPREQNAKKKLKEYINKYNFFGLNLHPRLNKFNILEKKTIDLVNYCGKLNVPVTIDAFPDGNLITSNFKISDYGELCKKCKNTNIILAHFGGIYCLEAMLMAKRIENLYLNFAYTLLYFRESSVTKDLIYCIKSLKGNKIFYGSDYPDRDYLETLRLTFKEFKKYKLEKNLIKKVMLTNAERFIKIYDKKI